MIVTVTTNAALDRTLTVPVFQIGFRHRSSEVLVLAGGKGINVARTLKILEVPVVATGLAGGRTGTRIIEELTSEAILNDFVRIAAESRTSTAVVDPTAGTHTEINEWGPEVTEVELEMLTEKLHYLSRGADFVVLSGSLPRKVPTTFYADAVRDLARRDVRVVLDSEGEPLRLAVEAGPFLVSPNQREAEQLVGQELEDDDDFLMALDAIAEMGARNVLITLENGCFALMRFGKKTRRLRAFAPHVEPVSGVGSGDVLLGQFLASISDEREPDDSVRAAVAAGAASVREVGAGRFDPTLAATLAADIELAELRPRSLIDSSAMAACPSCGVENPPEARFCMSCAAPLAVEPAREQRKVVTVLFCDLVGSTALGESTDPEALRARMRRYFEDLRTILERHGGSVEKFVGDAVMAVFGIPVSHEDDALRAVRAASEMRDAIAEHGLEARIGINTGEVVVGGESETLVTGDAVNVAARLEQAAGSGEILIGSETRLLVRDAVRTDAVEPLTLKGKSGAVEAFRLLEVMSDAAPLARHPETPLVGRERERQRLWRAYEDAVADGSCQVFTLLGPAGIGKSRLVADFLERVGAEADVLRGRCLSYGEGITYWPLVEILIAIGVEPESVIGSSPPETQLAFRRLLEARAAARPQVVVVDDLQWAESVFVDLVEHVADLSRDAPIFLLCIARTELLDVRPGWGGGKMNATSLLLEPLGAEECADLMSRLVPRRDARRGVARAHHGGFGRKSALCRGDARDGARARRGRRDRRPADDPRAPAGAHRLARRRRPRRDGARSRRGRGLPPRRGGRALARGTSAAASSRTSRRSFARSSSARPAPTFPDDEGFRFRHLLIRDAAYESLAEGDDAPSCTSTSPTGSPHTSSSSATRSSAITSSRHSVTARARSGDPALDRLARLAHRGTWQLQAAAPSIGVTSMRPVSLVLRASGFFRGRYAALTRSRPDLAERCSRRAISMRRSGAPR